MSLAWIDEHIPSLTAPIMIVALEGWNDAGDAATHGLEQLALEWDTELVARITDEAYFPYSQVRPTIELVDGIVRSISVPSIDVIVASPPDADFEVLMVLGPEPGAHWHNFVADMLDLADTFDVRDVYLLGAISADVPHTRPVHLTGAAYSPRRLKEVGLEPATYHGPAGVALVLLDELTREGVPATAAFAAVPHYVAANPAPASTLGLLRWLSAVTGLEVPLQAIEGQAAEWRRHIDAAAESDEDLSNYVRELEEQFDSVQPRQMSMEIERSPQERIRLVDGDQLAAEFEQYLKRDGDADGGPYGDVPRE